MSDKIVKSKFFFEEDFIETIGEVSSKEYKSLPPNKKLKYVGKPLNRKDAPVKASGKAKFTFDIELPHMVYARTLRSPHPNAIIKDIDTLHARQVPGVFAILHTFNMSAFNGGKIEWYGNSFLFDPHVRYVGDEIACVAAKDEETAERALKLIDVKYEILDYEIDAKKSMNSKLKIHPDGNVRRGKPFEYERGSVKDGFDEADEIIEDEFSTQVAVHNPTEPHCSVADWNKDKLTIYDSTQAVFRVRNMIADALDTPKDSVRIIKEYMGGGFGGKLEAGKYSVMAALLAKKLKRPVKILNDRREQNIALGNRPDSVQKLKIGVKTDGTITALNHYAYAAIGAYPSGGGCSWPLRTLYKCDNVRTEEYSVYTNAGRARAFRAPGNVQGTFGLESLLDEAAEKIGMDPLEFRVKNFVDFDQVGGKPYTSKMLIEAYKIGAKKIGWENRNKIPGGGKGYVKRGVGMASQIWWGGGGPPAHVRLELDSNGKIVAFAGSQDLGTGTYTFVAQVIGEILEIAPDNIDVVLGDTDRVPYGPSSGGSTTAPSISPAARDAAERMKEKLISNAAALWNVESENVGFENGTVFMKNDKSKKLSAKDIVAQLDDKKISALGSREANPDGYSVQTFGAQFAEVEVDTLTGNVRVLKVVAVHDVGRILNGKTLENQFHGGIIMGIGFALTEEQIRDEYTGKILNDNFHDYKVPTIKETPEIEVFILGEGDMKANNMGVKGIGEPAMIPTPAAIANAVYNAIGKRIKSLPITPDKIITALYDEA
ncbi:MAG: xanthine dehydrogenase family protein molybdopterin-binding subunit [Chlorobi bacterium]|nr:xanthine dehydrogenase family protein molybdopterin-binding subunit [Chlorobiota bacterium]